MSAVDEYSPPVMVTAYSAEELQGIAEFLSDCSEPFRRAMLALGEQMRVTLRRLQAMMDSLPPGWLPPNAETVAHGTRWTSSLTGETQVVRGRRGRPATYHWGEIGPKRWRVHG